ncbi:MAG: reverse transcriptase-like protein [Candidatus Saccharimonadales bacterium]
MKQKVVTKALIRQDGKVLLLRRKGGRPSINGMYELPGGRVHINQQPEDALEHALLTHIGVSTDTVQLDDVMTFIDPDDRELQYVFIVFVVSLKPGQRDIQLSQEYDKYVWKKLSDIQLSQITQSTQQLLGLAQIPFSIDGRHDLIEVNDAKKSTSKKIIAYSDGGSRGNPGPSASGYVLMDERGEIVYEGGAYLGHTTNNVAEYQAVYLAMQKALEHGATMIDMRMDSQLVANQMNGIYKIKKQELAVIHHRIQELSSQFEKVSYTYVAREYNKLADGMVNKVLDEHQNTTDSDIIR